MGQIIISNFLNSIAQWSIVECSGAECGVVLNGVGLVWVKLPSKIASVCAHSSYMRNDTSPPPRHNTAAISALTSEGT